MHLHRSYKLGAGYKFKKPKNGVWVANRLGIPYSTNRDSIGNQGGRRLPSKDSELVASLRHL